MKKKTPLFFFLVILFSVNVFLLRGQYNRGSSSGKQDTSVSGKRYQLLSFYSSVLMFHKSYGTLDVAFPYSSNDLSNGTTTSGVFNASAVDPFKKNQFYSGFDYEIGGRKFFGSARAGLGYRYVIAWDFCFGGGYNFFIQKDHALLMPVHKEPLVLKFSANFGINSFSYYLGNIDNKTKSIGVLGYYANPVYVSGGKYSHNVNAKTLDVYYEQNLYSFVPQIALTNNPFNADFHWEIDFGWLIPFRERGGLLLEQDKGGHVINSTPMNVYTQDLTLEFNKTPVVTTPFRFGGPTIRLSIGWRLDGKCCR